MVSQRGHVRREVTRLAGDVEVEDLWRKLPFFLFAEKGKYLFFAIFFNVEGEPVDLSQSMRVW